MTFQKATKRQAKLRMALVGPSGSGKTYTALKVGTLLGKTALVDTERGSASKYADKFSFDVLELDNFHPQQYINAIHEAEQAGYEVLVIDSLSHAWMGKGGALELVDNAAKKNQSQNTFAAWRDVTPLQNALVDAIMGSKLHLIATMRSKTAYSQEKDERGKTVIRKVGMEAVQRDGIEYEFDVDGDMDLDNTLIISKSRCEALNGAVIPKPGVELAEALKAWLTDGAPAVEPVKKLVDTKADYHADVALFDNHSSGGKTEPANAANQDKGKWPLRPWNPDTLRDKLRIAATRPVAGTFTDGGKGAIVGKLDEICGGTDKRHTLLRDVFNVSSSKELIVQQWAALDMWLRLDSGGNFKPTNTFGMAPDMAGEEAQRLINSVTRSEASAVGELFPEAENVGK